MAKRNRLSVDERQNEAFLRHADVMSEQRKRAAHRQEVIRRFTEIKRQQHGEGYTPTRIYGRLIKDVSTRDIEAEIARLSPVYA